MKTILCTASAIGSLLFASALLASASPSPRDFARALLLKTQDEKPIQTLLLPEQVYATSTTPTLADLRVFNAAGMAVPHSLCAQHSRQETLDQALPLYRLDRAADSATAGTDVRVDSGGSVQVRIEAGERDTVGRDPVLAAHVIDARQIDLPLQALRLHWQTEDGSSEIPVRVQASTDLNQWHVVVRKATLMQLKAVDATATDASPQRVRIDLPLRQYDYLRIERIGSGPHPLISDVIGEALLPPAALVHHWYSADPTPAPDKPADAHDRSDQRILYYETARKTGASLARVALPAANMSLRIALESRPDSTSGWQHRWQGEVHNLGETSDRVPIQFPSINDRLWRLRILAGAETLPEAGLALELGVVPQVLRFLVQGEPPFTLAYGSGDITQPGMHCNQLLADMGAEERAKLTGVATVVGENNEITGGDAALQPAESALPWQRILLWLVLLAGAALLVRMSFTLIRQAGR